MKAFGIHPGKQPLGSGRTEGPLIREAGHVEVVAIADNSERCGRPRSNWRDAHHIGNDRITGDLTSI